MTSILKIETAKYSTNDKLEEARRVRFDIPQVPLANSVSTSGDYTQESSRKTLEATAEPSRPWMSWMKPAEPTVGTRPWMTWMKPILDPIQACTTGDCRPYSRQQDAIDAGSNNNDVDAGSASSFDSSITSLSQLLDAYPSKSDAFPSNGDSTKLNKWRKSPPPVTSILPSPPSPGPESVLGIRSRAVVHKAPPPATLLPPSPPSPGLESVLGIRNRSAVHDEERRSTLLVCGTDTTLRSSTDRVFSPKGRQEKQNAAALSMIKGGYVDEAGSGRISITPDMVEL